VKTQPSYLLFGQLPPTPGTTSAVTVRAALWLKGHGTVTVVIPDQAIPPEVDPGLPPYIRQRTLAAEAGKYADHIRLYILGDDHQSLQALNHYRTHGGAIIPTGVTLSTLHRLDHEARDSTLTGYRHWLQEALGEVGEIIAHAQEHHKRESETLLREIEIGVLNAAYSDETFLLNTDILAPATYLFDINEKFGAAPKIISTEPIVSVLVDGATPPLDELLELTKGTLPPFVLQPLRGDEPDLAARVAGSDLLLVLAMGDQIPAAVLLAAKHGKPVITTSQSWLKDLPKKMGENIPKPSAKHALKAALGSLLLDPALRDWYGAQAAALYAQLPVAREQDAILKAVKSLRQSKLKVHTSHKHPSRQAGSEPRAVAGTAAEAVAGATDAATAAAAELFGAPKGSVPVALIGAVPPLKLTKHLLPFVNWDESPRFATPEIAEILCHENDRFPANRLALLGYEAPLIGDAEGCTPLAEIQQELKAVKAAISFGTAATGAVDVRRLLGETENLHYQAALVFEGIATPKTLSFHSESSGLYWQRDPVAQTVEAILIAGLGGRYKCSASTTSNAAFVLAQEYSTKLLKSGETTELQADTFGIIKFTISAHSSPNMNPLSDTLFVETLAQLQLNLEWLGHVQK